MSHIPKCQILLDIGTMLVFSRFPYQAMDFREVTGICCFTLCFVYSMGMDIDDFVVLL